MNSNAQMLEKQDLCEEAHKEVNLYHLIQVEGDPGFRLTAKSARKNGAKVEFTAAGWVYQNKKDAEDVKTRWEHGKRRIKVVPWFDPRLDVVWFGSKEESKIAKKTIRLEIDSAHLNKKRQEIALQCYHSPIHHSWLYEDDIFKLEAAGCSKKEIEAYKHFKPLWDKTFEEEEEIDLRGTDIAREEDDIVESTINQGLIFEDVSKGLIRNERGDAELFLKLKKENYVFDPSEGRDGQFYFWNGTFWQIDRRKQRYKDIEVVSEVYEQAAIQAGKNEKTVALSKEFSKRAHSIRSIKRCKSIFEFVSSEVPLEGEWDCCQGQLPCLNGLVDLKTGKISPHKPEFFLRSVCPTSYNPSAPRPLFDKFLNDITLGKKEIKTFLGRILGYALLGIPKEERVFIFYGKNGRNGKGTLLQTLEKVLGPIAKTFPSEMLLLQRNPPSSSTPRPEKANLQGARFAIFSEIDEHRKLDASEVKNLSGRDTINCRRLFSNVDIQIRPSHTMFIQTNFKPKASAKDGALWKRNILVPFNAEFVDNPVESHQRKLDETTKDNLLLEKEGILAWLVECCLEYQKIGLHVPQLVKDETENYRKENDGIQLFIEEKCIKDPIFATPRSKMTASIQKFCKENNYDVPSRNAISETLKKEFKEGHSKKGDFWCGIKIYDETECQND